MEREPGKPVELSDLPLIKGFVVRQNQSESINTFYENNNKVNKLYNTYTSFNKNGQPERAKELLKKNPDLKKYSAFSTAYNQITNINKNIDRIVANKNLSDDVKRDKIEKLNDRRVKIARKVNAFIK